MEIVRKPIITRVPIRRVYGYIYLTTCNITGKQYIGRRKWSNPNKPDSYLGSGSDYKKDKKLYGKENFSKEILNWSESSDALVELEKFYISLYNAVEDPNFYNISPGGEHWFEGCHHSEESRRKISLNNARHNSYLSEEERKKIGDFHRGKKYSEETRRKISKNNGMHKIKNDPVKLEQFREKVRSAMPRGKDSDRYGTHWSEEVRRKISDSRKGKTVGADNPSARAVVQLTLDGEFVREYSYARQTRDYGFDPSSVGSCCRGQYKQHKGYRFMYKDDYNGVEVIKP